MEKYEVYLPEVVFTDEMNACSCSCKGQAGGGSGVGSKN